MKKSNIFLIFLFLFTKISFSQSSSTTLDVVGWNIEFYGDPSNGPSNDDLQEANVKKVMRYLDADIYGLCEIVDTMRLRRLVDSLGTNYAYKIADFCSNNTSGTGPSWLNGQKLAFIYKINIFSNISFRGYMRSSATAYTNFASGRFPYIMNANATINGFTRNINFIMIHGKAGSTVTDFDRRRAACEEMKDSMDLQYPNSINLIIGDYNDALNQTISIGAGPESSYDPIVVDSIDANHYKSITLPLAYLGQTTMINFPNVIDNHVISNEAVSYYIQGSAQIRTDVTNVVPDYVTAHNTSDHWPVFSKYNLAGVVTGVPNVDPLELGIRVYPNPFDRELILIATKTLTDVQMRVFNIHGQLISSQHVTRIRQGSTIRQPLPALTNGIYFLSVETKQYKTVLKLTKL